MIKEFWQERKEEKKKLKELKKQNKKLSKTKEQIAYKVFGVLMVFFLVFGSVFYTCSGSGDFDYSWDKLLGVTDEIKSSLSTPVDKSKLIENKELSIIDWTDCKNVLSTAGLDVVDSDNRFDLTKLDPEQQSLTGSIVLSARPLGALVSQMIEQGYYVEDIDLVELNIFQDGNIPMLRTLMYIDLSTVVLSSTLPSVYITTISRIEILDNELCCLDTEIRINDFDEKKNNEVLSVLDKSSLLGLEYYTNEIVVDKINLFADGIDSEIEISGIKLKFIEK